MKNLKKNIINSILNKEKGYVFHKNDRGGETNYGITKRVAREHGYIGTMRRLPRTFAFQIYATTFWEANRLDDILSVSLSVAKEVADTGVNMHPRTASKFLQRSLNLLNRNQRDFNDLVVDGYTGDKTIKALKLYILKRKKEGEKVLVSMLNTFQGYKYIRIAELDKSQEVFTFGWFSKRVVK